jgi:lysophospholipase L1-like esterase
MKISHAQWLWLFLLIVPSMTLLADEQQTDKASPDTYARWEPEIAKFEAEDARVRRRPGAILFVGSSSIRLWDLGKSFPDHATINRGFGGSQIDDSVHFANRIVTSYQSPVVVMYAGDNDIASGKSPERVAADFEAFVSVVREKLPETQIVFIGIKPSIARWKLVGKVREANKLIQSIAEVDKRLTFIDVDGPMIGDDGLPRKELFRDDGLHLNDAGYALWTKLVLPHLPK